MIRLLDTPDNDIAIEAASTDNPRLKQVPGARYRSGVGWRVPPTPATVFTLHSLFRPEEIRNDAPKLLRKVQAHHSQLMQIRKDGEPLPTDPGDEDLYAFQRAGVRFLACARGVLLGDEMGTGKTIQVLTAIERLSFLNHGQHLVVCPNGLKLNWEQEAKTWAPTCDVVVIDGDAGKRRKLLKEAKEYDNVIVVINYEALPLHTIWKSPTRQRVKVKGKEQGVLNEFAWTSITLDEAHRIKNVKADTTQAAHGVAHVAQPTYRWALTGTPIANHEGDLWPLLNWVDPSQFPDKSRFHRRYLMEQPGFFGGIEVTGLHPHHEQELHHILDTVMLRRTKAEVLPHLPPKTYTQRHCPMSPKQKKAYADFKKELVLALESGMIAGRSIGEELARLRQLACGMPVVDDATGEVIELEGPSSKVDTIFEMLEEIGDDPLAIYVDHAKFLSLIVRKLRDADIPTGYIAGGMTAVEKDNVVQAFQSGKIRVLVATCAAAAEGITLTRSSRLVFAQLPYSSIHYKQAQDRVHRPGAEAHDNIEIITLLTPGTIETKVPRMLADKAAALDNITQDTKRLLELLKEED